MPLPDEGPSPEDIEAGRLLFARAWTFSRGSPDLDHLAPDDRPEIAFAGRSNVGKSTLINALVGQHGLARASNTPGRTQELNFFVEPERALYLVDMPGYGFAEAPKDKVAAWNRTLRGYLAGRRSLLRVFLLVDARHGLKAVDNEIMALLDGAAVSYQVVLTKADKIKETELARVIEKSKLSLAKHPAAYPDVIATSADKGTGFEVLRATIAKLLEAHGG
ncbi:YihA family ribosome biogenesis GTP-binding protein [Hyphomicrobium methylovorum]|uniref:ribosome biogenesis GTP-binding protein YihA/YsxC n=1 Tax=Hyphomicrobium methylovorum TaxID=84 RepID=UPI0015E7D74A|nr:ribosome biogenesis GTP-binding protein YihA/YsxC [Hyphomicrobium methylovorum]MBA2126292.1 YihA family ribosome biogenesis GTP-binding protein [Hyphomicrobium methylovorum]